MKEIFTRGEMAAACAAQSGYIITHAPKKSTKKRTLIHTTGCTCITFWLGNPELPRGSKLGGNRQRYWYHNWPDAADVV